MRYFKKHPKLRFAILLIAFASEKALFAQTQRFPISVSDDRDVSATLIIPDGLKNDQKVPAFMIFGGFESAGQVLELIHPNHPVALASFDYPFSAPRSVRLADGAKILHEAKTLFPETTHGIAELAKRLKTIPQIDPRKIVIIGASFGSPFAVSAAARDPELAGVAIVHGFGKIPQTAEHVILRSWLPKYGSIAKPAAWLISRLGALYLGMDNPEISAQKLTSAQHVLMITASEDSFIPRESSDSLWVAIESSKAQKTRILMPGEHLMPGADQTIAKMVELVEAWVQKF